MRASPIALAAFAAFVVSPFAFAGVEIKEEGDRVRIEIDGRLFTEYRHADASHVYFYPIIGPGGAKMTRAWPMEEARGEEHDHPHHRSLWFSHGEVNGVDFWTEASSHGNRQPKHPIGKIVHAKVLAKESNAKWALLQTQQRWIAPDGSVPIESVTTFRVHARPDSERLLDFEIALVAGEKDVLFGDTKEGTMAIRIAESMRLKQPKGKTGEGHIINDKGDKDGEAWGKRAAWVDMSGPVDGKVLGIAMFDHPKNLRHPTRWHARDYGLFAANPFCEYDMDKSKPKGSGDYTLKAGETLTLKYRIYIHEGDAAQGKVAERFAEYAASPQ